MPITYLKGDATCPQAKGRKVIAHICNDIGKWGAGFVLAISKRWAQPEASYREWYNQDRWADAVRPQNTTAGKIVLTTGPFALGQVQLVQVLPDTFVVNMVAQAGTKTGSKGPPIRYEALATCLERLDAVAGEGASIHMPRIGCGLAGGKWDRVEPLVAKALSTRSVLVYDF